MRNELRKSDNKRCFIHSNNVGLSNVFRIFRISTTRFFELANEIYNYFPHENPNIYYVPYVKNEAGKPKAARGKLWGTYINMIKKLQTLGYFDESER